jgi:hypothetical protein
MNRPMLPGASLELKPSGPRPGLRSEQCNHLLCSFWKFNIFQPKSQALFLGLTAGILPSLTSRKAPGTATDEHGRTDRPPLLRLLLPEQSNITPNSFPVKRKVRIEWGE